MELIMDSKIILGEISNAIGDVNFFLHDLKTHILPPWEEIHFLEREVLLYGFIICPSAALLLIIHQKSAWPFFLKQLLFSHF